jgi:hypothetical protein
MKQIRLTTLLTLSAMITVVISSGCGRKVEIRDERKVVMQDSRYETLWVEPQIVMSDSLFTVRCRRSGKPRLRSE